VRESGLNSGFMIPQYTCAALVSENKVLAHPASVDSITTSACQEDHVSMGAHAARKARTILENAFNVLAIEILTAAQGLDFSLPLRPGKGTEAAYSSVRRVVPFYEKDALMEPLIRSVHKITHSGELVAEVESAIGNLG
jgi:histidine ammonia-lyase